MRLLNRITLLAFITTVLVFGRENIFAQTRHFRIESSKLLTTNRVVSTNLYEDVDATLDLNNGYNTAFMVDFNSEKRFGWSVGLSVKKQSVKILTYEMYNVTIDPDGNVNVDGMNSWKQESFHYGTLLVSGNIALLSKETYKLKIEVGFDFDFLFYSGKQRFYPHNTGYSVEQYQTFNLNSFASLNLERNFSNGWMLGFKLPYITTALTPNYKYVKTYDSMSTLKQYFTSFGIGLYLGIPANSGGKK